MIPPRAHDDITGTENSNEGVLTDFLTPIITNINGEPTKESITEIHRLISRNAAYMESNLGGSRHGHLALTMTVEEYLDQTGHEFVSTHNPRN